MIDDCVRKILLLDEDIEFCCKLLLKITFESDDWRWVQDTCLEIIKGNRDKNICGLAVTCLGHISRIHNDIDRVRVLEVLNKNKENLNISDRIEDAIDDINMFTQSRKD